VFSLFLLYDIRNRWFKFLMWNKLNTVLFDVYAIPTCVKSDEVMRVKRVFQEQLASA